MAKAKMRSTRNPRKKAHAPVKAGLAAVEHKLDSRIGENESNRLVWEATERFLRSGAEIKDVYGTLDR